MTAATARDRGKPCRPRVVTSRRELLAPLAEARAANRRIGLVPTMGALHEGHLSLVRAARVECDFSVVTIFVNPTQFGPQEDFRKYPRAMEADLNALAHHGVDLVFAPPPEEMYPQGFSTYVEPPQVALSWEGRVRPGHFRGVATVVLKLFHLIPADVAFFGQKDYQQCLVIRDMLADLDLPISLRMCPIVREPDGLAMSSRNRYLRPHERRQAVAISRSLKQAEELFATGERDSAVITGQMQRVIEAGGIARIDYVALADAQTLQPLPCIEASAVALVAAYAGETRLIDNCLLGEIG